VYFRVFVTSSLMDEEGETQKFIPTLINMANELLDVIDHQIGNLLRMTLHHIMHYRCSGIFLDKYRDLTRE
jgi:hypothetical protein